MTEILYGGTLAGRSATSDLTVTGLEITRAGNDWLLLSETGRGSALWEAELRLNNATLTQLDAGLQGSTGRSLLDYDSNDSDGVFLRDPITGLLRLREDVSYGASFDTLSASAGLGITQALKLDDTFVLVARNTLDGPAILRLTPSNVLEPVGLLSVPAFNGAPVTDMSLARFGGQTVAVAISAEADSLASFTISASGDMALVESRGALDGLGINTPMDVTTAEVNGKHFALVASFGTSSLSVLEVAADGGLTLRDQINDNRFTRFEQTQQVETIAIDGRQYVATAGTDGGLTVFRLLDTGQLLHVATYSGNQGTAAISDLELAADDTHLHLFAASDDSGDIRHFTLDLGTQDRLRIADDRNISGSSGDDILIAESGRPNLTGNAGRDLFVIGTGVDRAGIRDYNPDEDQIDLSFWPRIYSLDAMSFTSLSDGVRISFTGLTLNIRTHDRSSLDRDDFQTEDLLRLWRLPPDEQQGDNSDTSDQGAATTLEGTHAADVLLGSTGHDQIIGLSGNDRIDGRDGNDLIRGDNGQDTLTGGSGNDTFVFRGLSNAGDIITDYAPGVFDLNSGSVEGDIALFEGVSLPSVTRMGDDLHIGGVTLAGAADGNLMFAYTALTVAPADWQGPLQAGNTPYGTNLTLVLQDTGQNEAFRLMTGLFSTSGNLNRIVVDNDDNSRLDYRYDPDEAEPWDLRILTYSRARDLTKRTDHMDDGGRLELNYDPTDNRSWDTLSYLFDSAGGEAEYNIYYDTGLHLRRLTDTQNGLNWHEITEYRNAGGALYEKRTLYDTNEMLRVITDADNRSSWASLLEKRDAAGRIYDKTTDYDTGLSTRNVFDTSNTESWSRLIEKRDTTEALEEKLTYFDSGLQQRLIFDVSDAAHWDRIEEQRDAAGRLTEKNTVYDTGIQHENFYDPTNDQAWTRLLRVRDSADSLTEEVIYDDDGSRIREIFDPNDTRSWSRLDEYRNAEGRLYEKFFVFDDAQTERIQYDINGRSWREITETRDAAGRITETTITYDTLTQIRDLFDAADSFEWRQITEYRNRDGALYDKRTTYDDDTQNRLIIDVDAANTWDRIQELRDASGALTKKTVFYDTGHSQLTLFDVANTESWDSYTRFFDTDGALLSETFA